MRKVVLLGRGAAGKSTAARKLGEATNLPVFELDKYFWQPGLTPLSNEEWKSVQEQLAHRNKWIMDGDLGKYDVLSERLKFADTVMILDFPLRICFPRALKRSKERMDFWWWLVTWRLSELPKIRNTIETYAPNAKVITFRSPKQLDKFLEKLQLLSA